MAISLEGSEKEGHIYNLRSNMYYLVKKIVKIGPVDPEIIGLQEIIKKTEISEEKHTARSARMPSGLN